ncbi:hypothetical protein HAX54_007279, partial [Datura stramonium]|nr:hypothetical protein [Datura stramonium]
DFMPFLHVCAGATQEDLEVVGTKPACRKLASADRKCYSGSLEETIPGPVGGLAFHRHDLLKF